MKKRGPKSAAELRVDLEAMQRERNDFRAQLLRRETDFENRVRAVHSSEIRELKSKLETDGDSARKAREKAERSAAEAAGSAEEIDTLKAQLAAERIRAEGELQEAVKSAELASQKVFNIAIAVKEQVMRFRPERDISVC